MAKRDFKSIAVPMFRNRTLRPQLEAQVTNAIIKGLQEDGSLRIQSQPNADVVLEGEIIRYERNVLRFLQSETRVPREFEIAITVRVEAKDAQTGIDPDLLPHRAQPAVKATEQHRETGALHGIPRR